MLKLFKTHLAIIPSAIILALMFLLRLDVLNSNYRVNHWLGELSPFSEYYLNLFGNEIVSNVIFNIILSAVLVFFQSGIILSIFSFYKIKDFGFLPAWLFVLIMHLHPNLVFLSPQLLSLTFILLSFRKLLFYTENKTEIRALFEIGLFLGVATMFWSPSILFLFFILNFLHNNFNLSLKRLITILFACFIPILYAIAYLFISQEQEISQEVFKNLVFNTFDLNVTISNALLSFLVYVFLVIFSLFSTQDFASKQLRKVREFVHLLYMFLLNVFLVYLFQKENNINILVFLFFPTSIFLSIFFNRIKPKVLSEFIHLILLLTIIINFIYFT